MLEKEQREGNHRDLRDKTLNKRSYVVTEWEPRNAAINSTEDCNELPVRQRRGGKGSNLQQENEDTSGETSAIQIRAHSKVKSTSAVWRRREGALTEQEKKERAAAFMASLEESTDEEEWSEDSGKMDASNDGDSSTEDFDLSTLLFNSQSILSNENQDDPDYVLPCSQHMCHRVSPFVHSVGSTNNIPLQPCSMMNETRSSEHMSVTQTRVENSMPQVEDSV